MGILVIKNKIVASGPFMSPGAGQEIIDQPRQLAIGLSSDQIRTLHSAPVSVLGPLTGWHLLVDWILFDMITTSTRFTGGGPLTFAYHTAQSTPIHAGAIPASTVTAPAGRNAKLVYCLNGSNTLNVPVSDGIDLLATDDFAGGTGTAFVVLGYRFVKQI